MIPSKVVLEKLALVERHPDNYDKRIHRIALTSAGTSVLQSLEDFLEEHNSLIIDQIDLDTQLHLLTVLEKLSWAIECVEDNS